MARDPTVKVSFIGDAGDLSKSIGEVDKKLAGVASDVNSHTVKVSGAFKKMGKDAEHGFKGVRDSADDTERRVTGFRDSLTGSADVMKGIREGDMVALATGFADLASSVANLGADLLDWGKKAIEGAKGVVQAHAASVIAKTKDIASMVAHKVATIASTVATQAQAVAQWALNAAMSANPIILVVAAIAALTAGVILAYKNFGWFRDAVDGAWQIIQATFDWIQQHWPLILAILTGPIGLAVIGIVKHWDTIKDTFTGVKDWIDDKIGDIVGFFTALPGRLADAGKGMFDWIKDSFKDSFNWVIRGWNGIEFSLPSVDTHIPGVGHIGGWTLGTPDIAELASGGLVKARPGGTVVRLGEGGQDEFVIPRNRMGGGGNVYNFTLNVSSLDPRSASDAVVEALLQYENLNGYIPIRRIATTG